MYVAAALSLLCGLSVLLTLGSLAQKPPVLSLVLGLLSLLLGAYILVLLHKRESSGYYDAQ